MKKVDWSRLKDADLVAESFEKAMDGHLRRMGLARVLCAFTSEEIGANLLPEERLAGLAEEEVVLALPDAVLRGLSKEYVAALPRGTRAAIRKRLGGEAGAKRAAGQPRKRGGPRAER